MSAISAVERVLRIELLMSSESSPFDVVQERPTGMGRKGQSQMLPKVAFLASPPSPDGLFSVVYVRDAQLAEPSQLVRLCLFPVGAPNRFGRIAPTG